MTAIRCTRKLLGQMGGDANRAAQAEAVAESPLDWYANLLWINRRKCVLFTNVGTLFGFLVPAVRKPQLRGLPELFREHLRENLEHRGFEAAAVRTALRLYGEPTIQRATNRSVLGSMNDYAWQLELAIETDGLRAILAINQRVSDSPMSAIGYSSGNREMRKALAG